MIIRPKPHVRQCYVFTRMTESEWRSYNSGLYNVFEIRPRYECLWIIRTINGKIVDEHYGLENKKGIQRNPVYRIATEQEQEKLGLI